MPIYEYRCESCGHELEALQKISDEPLTQCPACSRATLARLISAPRFRLKGSGWYETDFKKGGSKKNIAGDGESSSSGSSESKPSSGGGAASDNAA
ncbi:MAG: zinc ribbon domain-containing protein [Pseudomonadota bacterium]|nr:zinc ribbon domain-containing protein [Pseudomonadota bacterium]